MYNVKLGEVSGIKGGLTGGEYLKYEAISLKETVITRIPVRHNMQKCI
jgi:hypothetical protein